MAGRLRSWAMLGMVLLLGACTAVKPPAPPVVAPAVVDPAQACLQELRDSRVVFEPMKDFFTDRGCGIENPVKVSQAAIPWNRPAVLTCSLAQTLRRFESEVVQPAAQRLLGQGIRRIHHAGTYDCRNERGGKGRMSQHGLGKAIDISGFEAEDGSLITIKTHWKGAARKSEFLQQVARASCDMFNVVLTPNRDAEHQDHLHLDVGPYRLCGM